VLDGCIEERQGCILNYHTERGGIPGIVEDIV